MDGHAAPRTTSCIHCSRTTSSNATPRPQRRSGTRRRTPGVRQIVYLGGLGDLDDKLSAHLRSRRDVEQLLGLGGVPVTVLRAAVVVGHGGISWEITRQLVDHLPAMVTPKWVNTRTQPIALPDVIRYLVGVLDRPEAIGRVFEVGGPEVLRYVDMMRQAAQIQNRRTLPIVPVPLLTPRLSSMWLALVTDVDQATARNLVDSMNNEVIVQDDAIRDLVPGELMTYRRCRAAGAGRPGGRAGPGRVGSATRPSAVAGRAAGATVTAAQSNDEALANAHGPSAAPGVRRQGSARPSAIRLAVPAPPGRRRHHPGRRCDAARDLVERAARQPGVLPADDRAGGDLGDRWLRLRPAASRPHPLSRGAAPAGDPADPASAWRRRLVFIVGALVVREIPLLRDLTENVLAFARYGRRCFSSR